jgi:hypothetical protein
MCKKWLLHGNHTPPSNLTRSKMNRDEDICPMKMKQHGLDYREPKKNYNLPKSNKFISF